ncbi:hypothetical protein FRC03_001840 [Tulasnella sp. 419]|nr:hypothetical protein FRC03_001840 [Tulasnella sp. 419]
MDSPQGRFPIERLPVELLCNILEQCCEVVRPPGSPRQYGGSANDILRARQATSPAFLTHVSKTWRYVAIQLPSLWTFIKATSHTLNDRITTWLERTGASPLDIFIIASGNQLQRLYNLLLPHMHRWREFHIKSSGSHSQTDMGWSMAPFLKTTTDSNGQVVLLATKLRHLTLSNDNFQDINESLELKSLSLVAPTLTTLVVDWISLDWGLLTTPMSHITSFEVAQIDRDRPYFGEFMRVISNMTSLRQLRVDVLYSRHTDLTGYPMDLPELWSFTLSIFAYCGNLWSWLMNIKAPRLQCLTVDHLGTQYLDEDEEWHDERDKNGWSAVQDAIHWPSLTDLRLAPCLKGRCQRSLSLLLPVITTVINMTIDVSALGIPLSSFLSFLCTFPALKHVKIVNWEGRDEVEKWGARDAIARLNIHADVIFQATGWEKEDSDSEG